MTRRRKITSKSVLALVFLGSIALVPVTSRANASHPDIPSICDGVAGNLVANCGFETGDFSDWSPSPASTGSNFRVTFGFPHSGISAALFGAFGAFDDSISQVLSTTAGRPLDVSFFLQNDILPAGTANFSVSWDGKRVFSAPTTEFGYTQFSFVALGTGSDTLQFAGRNHTGFYFLDDIAVTPGVVPEPSTLSLFGLGLLFGGALLWHKKGAG